jgi:hypothetical protein
MRKVIARCLAAAALAVVVTIATPASATTGTISGKVIRILVPSTGNGSSFFMLSGTNIVGNCTNDGSHTLALFPDDDRGKQMLSLVQAAWLSGKSLTVTLDDNVATTNYCFARSLNFP